MFSNDSLSTVNDFVWKSHLKHSLHFFPSESSDREELKSCLLSKEAKVTFSPNSLLLLWVIIYKDKHIVLCLLLRFHRKNGQNINSMETSSIFPKAIWLFFSFARTENKTDLEKYKVNTKLSCIFPPSQPKHSLLFCLKLPVFYVTKGGIAEHHPSIKSRTHHIRLFYYYHFLDGESEAPNKVE